MFWRKKAKAPPPPGTVQIDKLLVDPTGPSLSTCQILSSNNFEPIGQSFPYDVEAGEEGVRANIDYVRKELRRWKRSVAILADAVADKEELVCSARWCRIIADRSNGRPTISCWTAC